MRHILLKLVVVVLQQSIGRSRKVRPQKSNSLCCRLSIIPKYLFKLWNVFVHVFKCISITGHKSWTAFGAINHNANIQSKRICPNYKTNLFTSRTCPTGVVHHWLWLQSKIQMSNIQSVFVHLSNVHHNLHLWWWLQYQLQYIST